MDLLPQIRRTNAAMAGFDLALGAGTLLAPKATLKLLGFDAPSPDAETLFRRCGPIWLTFAAAHAVAATRDQPEDWWALAWLRATEFFTDVVWATSPAVKRPGTKTVLRLAGVGNLALTAQFVYAAKRGRPTSD